MRRFHRTTHSDGLLAILPNPLTRIDPAELALTVPTRPAAEEPPARQTPPAWPDRRTDRR